MGNNYLNQIDVLVERYPSLSVCKNDIIKAVNHMIKSYENSGKLLICGNGGSSSDSDHIVGELMKGFEKKRIVDNKIIEKISNINEEDAKFLSKSLQQGLPAIALTVHSASMTAFANDSSAEAIFANQVLGYGNKDDVFLGISTSGNSKNVVLALEVAKAKGLVTVALTGERDSKLSKIADVTIKVPSQRTYQIQELHLPVYHAICLALEDYFFDI